MLRPAGEKSLSGKQTANLYGRPSVAAPSRAGVSYCATHKAAVS